MQELDLFPAEWYNHSQWTKAFTAAGTGGGVVAFFFLPKFMRIDKVY